MAFKTFIDGIGAGQGSQDNSAGSFTSGLTALISEGVQNKSRDDFEVTPFTGRTVDVAKGEAFIENDDYVYGSFDQRFVPVSSDSKVNLSVDPNSSGSTRIDLVCLKFDASVSAGVEGVNASSAVVVKGTAGAGTPAIPNNHLVLASLSLPSGFNTISSITDLRVQARLQNYVYDEPALDNNKSLTGAETGGTQRNLVKINASDEVEVGDASADDTVIRGKSSARMYLGTTQTNLTNAASVKILLDTSDWDNNALVNTENNKITAKTAGVYMIAGNVRFDNVVANKRYQAEVYVNSVRVAFSIQSIGADTGVISVPISVIAEVGAGEDVELFAQSSSGDNTVDVGSGQDDTWLSLALISSP